MNKNDPDSSIFRTDYYPLVYIPSKIIDSINHEITDQEAIQYLNPKFPKLELIPLPHEPLAYYIVPRSSIRFTHQGGTALYLCVSFAIGSLAALSGGALFIGLILGLVAFFSGSNAFRTVSKNQKVEIPNDIYEARVRNYNSNREAAIVKNTQLKKEHTRKVKRIEKSIPPQKLNKAKQELYYSNLKPDFEAHNATVVPKRGRSEVIFLRNSQEHLVIKSLRI